MKGIILPTITSGKISANSIVEIDGGYFTVIKIDPRYNKQPGEPDNEYKYFVKSKVNGELMNFAKNEIRLVYLSVCDHDKYFNDNKQVFLGNISSADLLELKYKIVVEENLVSIEDVYPDDMIELVYDGTVTTKNVTTSFDTENDVVSTINYFKLEQKITSL